MPGPRHFDPDILRAALLGLERRRDQLDAMMRDVRARLEARGVPSSAPIERPSISPAGRRRIAAAQKKRWAEYHKAKKRQAARTRPEVEKEKPAPAPEIPAPQIVEPVAEPVVQAQAAAAGE
jgi:hypothetical protein